MKKNRLLFWGCLLMVGAVCIAVSLQNIGIPVFEKPDLSKLNPSPVVKIINSNTITVLHDGNEMTICLVGVDLPLSGSDSADRFVENLLKGESVFVLPDRQQKQADSNSGKMAYVYRAPDGLFVNAEIIRQGYGLASTKNLYKYMTQFHRLELFARQAEKGGWSGAKSASEKSIEIKASIEPSKPDKDAKPSSDNSVAPPVAGNKQEKSGSDDVTVFVTKSGTKYHSQGCRFLSKSSIPMKLKEAKIKYSPCSVCKPAE